MTPRVNAAFRTIGIRLPAQPHLEQVAIGGGLVIFALFAAVFLSQRFGPRLSVLWEDRVGHAGGLAARMERLIRHGSAALLILIVLTAWPWQPLAHFIIGFALAAATALFAQSADARPERQPSSSPAVMVFVLFAGLLANSVGGMSVLTGHLDAIGFTFSDKRYSVLTLIVWAGTAVLLFIGVRLANRLVGHSIERSRSLDATQQVLAQKVAGMVVLVVAVLIGIDVLGIDLTALAFFSGAFGLAIGFGFQKTFGNLISGIILLMDRSIKPGDVIVVGDSFGWVEKIGIRAVSVVTRDGKEHLIPNENLMTQEVENWSFTDKNVRVRIPVGVSYASDMAQVQDLMLQAARESPRVLDEPKSNVWMTEYGDSSVNFEILVWINDPEGRRRQRQVRRAQPPVVAVQGARRGDPVPAARPQRETLAQGGGGGVRGNPVAGGLGTVSLSHRLCRVRAAGSGRWEPSRLSSRRRRTFAGLPRRLTGLCLSSHCHLGRRLCRLCRPRDRGRAARRLIR